MARPTIENLRALPDFATLYQWNVALIKAPTGVTAPQNFNYQCMTTGLPGVSNQIIEVQIRGHKISQPGIQDYAGSMDFTFIETIDTAIQNFLEQWKESQWKTETGVHSEREAGKADFQIQLLDRKDNVIATYNLLGCILETFTLGELDGASSDTMKPSMTIKYDYYKKE